MKEKTNSFMGNVLMLMVAQVLIRFLGLIYKLVITNLDGFGDVGNGYYSAGYQIYTVLLLISSQGIPNAMSRLVSEKIALGEYKAAHRIFKIAFGLFGVIGGTCSILLYVSSGFIATNMLNVPDVKYVLMVLSPAIFFVSVSAVIRGYFAGLGTMKVSSTAQTLEQLFNCILSITFVYATIGREPYIMAAAGNLSTTVAILMSFFYLVAYYKLNNKKYANKYKNVEQKEESKPVKTICKTILMYAIPMTIGSFITAISSMIDTVTVSNCTQIAYSGILGTKEALEQMAMKFAGILSKVETLTNLPIAINLAFSSALVPAISAALAKKDRKDAARKISFSFACSIMIILPCAIGFSMLADSLLKMLYPNASDGAHILQIASVTMIFVALSQTLSGALFGLKRLYVPATAIAIGSIVKFILNIILIRNPKINIYGAAISSLVSQFITFVISYRVTKNEINLKLSFKKTILKPLLAGGMMAISIFIIQTLLRSSVNNIILTLATIIIGAAVYVFGIIILKVFEKEEILLFPMGDKLYKILRKIKVYE